MFLKIKNYLSKFLCKKVYAFVGRSGSGKSFRAQFVANKYNISLIIDDGLLIKNDRILAGKSAKQEVSVIAAVKRALFQDPKHCQEVKKVLDKERFRKILIIGTSEKMTSKIAKVLDLPEPTTVINIEDIATEDEIKKAISSRYLEGKHVIPVSPQQITRNYPHIVLDSVKVLGRKMGLKKGSISEKTIVKPEFTKLEHTTVSNSVISQILNQSLDLYSSTLKLESVVVEILDNYEYGIKVVLRTPVNVDELEYEDTKEFLKETLERYANILVGDFELTINTWE